jgi:glutamine cyclotransferase
MRGFVATLSFAASVLAAGLPSPAQASPLFLLDTDEATYAVIHRVNPQTGQLTTVGSVPAAGAVVTLAAAGDNTLYGISWSGMLYRITASPYAVTVVGQLRENRFVGLEYANGTLYATEEDTDLLVRINPTTAAVTPVDVIRVNGNFLTIWGGDLAQGTNGTWYLWTNNTGALYTLDITTAAATPVAGQVPFNGWRSGLAVDHATGKLYTSSEDFDEVQKTDPHTDNVSSAVTCCINCPTPHDLVFGDLASPRCTDADNDGFSAGGGACGPVDCNDANGMVNPLATDVCNGVDDDCDGAVDDGASALCSDGNACTLGDSCQAGACRAGTPRNCGLLNLIGATCRPSDGACCGKLLNGVLPLVSVCIK